MLAYLLAADPTTPADVLTYLAEKPNVAGDALALALAVHPNMPPDAHLNLPAPTVNALHVALTHPDLSLARRRQYIDKSCTKQTYLTWGVRAYDDFTPDELAYLHTTHPSPAMAAALAKNTHTPAGVAAQLVPELYREKSPTSELAADVLTLRCHLTPTNAATRTAAHAPDPLAAYAQHVLDGRTPYAAAHASPTWWAETIFTFPHPLITAAAFTHGDLGYGWLNTLTDNSRVQEDHRYRAAGLSATGIGILATDAPDHILAALIADGPWACGWDNPRATDTTLRAILNHTSWDLVPEGDQVALALHPGASARLRTDILAASSAVPAWLAPLVHHLNTRGTVLDAPMPALRRAADVATHAHHWAKAAWADARTTHPPVTLAITQALLALEAAHFAGTLRELIAAAHTVAA